ncbi:hypothetical protein SH611_04495 [Geminicoccaceae bacterium 1502E]|nr:hypothetical protein [Geminicoccaceae bacterium 1502E]
MRQLYQPTINDPCCEGVDLVAVMLDGEGTTERTALFKFVIHNLSNVEDVAIRIRVAMPDGSLDAAVRRAWRQLADSLDAATSLALDASRSALP